MRKTSINLASLAVIAIGIFLMWRLSNPRRQGEGSKPPHVAAFNSFPLNEAVPVEFGLEDEAFAQFSDLEKRQQMRDWTLLAVLQDSGAGQAKLQQALFNIPPARLDYLEGVGGLEYGETRSKVIGPGELVALVPKEPEPKRRDRIAAVADQARKETGELPKTIHVFEYALHPDAPEAAVRNLGTVDGSVAFGSDYGHRERSIESAQDLGAFMGSIDALSSVEVRDGKVVLGGRKIGGLGYRGIRVEEVAALWQAEKALEVVRQELEAFNKKWEHKTYRYDYERQALEREHDAEEAALTARLGVDAGSEGRAKQAGFSLDPAYDYERLTALYALIKSAVPVEVFEKNDAEIQEGLTNRKEGPLLDRLFELSQSEDPQQRVAAAGFSQLLQKVQFQHARYDGKLQGTEAGMILFYTDLMAKLWALDFERSAPSRDVQDFIPLIDAQQPAIYRKESNVKSNTRLWFGPQDDGFQKIETGIVFARNATRVYAAGSNPLKPGEESEPNYESGRFLSWWNNHYETIARYEPEYERLNELMKWSLAFASLQQHDGFEKLSFLAQVPVVSDKWFPDWAAAKDLRFHDWSNIGFFEEGHLGVRTESLPLLSSRVNAGHHLEGGVNLGSKSLLDTRPHLEKSIEEGLRRSNYRITSEASGEKILERMDKTAYRLGVGEHGISDVSITARPAEKFRGPRKELANGPLKMSLEARESGLKIGLQTSRDGKPTLGIGELTVERTPRGFRAAFQSRGIEAREALMNRIARAESQGMSAEQALARDPRVEQAILGEDRWYVKFKHEKQWARVEKEGAPQVDMENGPDMRIEASIGDFGGIKNTQSRFKFTTVSDSEMRAQAGSESYLFPVAQESGESAPEVYRLANKGPPSGGGGGGKGFKIGDFPPDKDFSDSVRKQFGRKTAGIFDTEEDLSSESRLALIASDDTRLRAYEQAREDAIQEIDKKLSDSSLTLEEYAAIEPLMKKFWADPAVRARGAIAKLKTGRMTQAVRDLSGLAKSGNAASLRALEESFRGLPQTAENVHNLNTIRDFIKGLEATNGNMHPGLQFSLYSDPHGTLGIEARILKMGPAVPEQEARASGLVYDAPVRADHPTVQYAGMAYREVPSWDVKMPVPDRIWNMETNELMTTRAPSGAAKASLEERGGRSITRWRTANFRGCPGGTDERSKENRSNEQDCGKRKVYVADPDTRAPVA
jgi:hypothetical protein